MLEVFNVFCVLTLITFLNSSLIFFYEVFNMEDFYAEDRGKMARARIIGEKSIEIMIKKRRREIRIDIMDGINQTSGYKPQDEMGSLGPVLRGQIPEEEHYRLGAFGRDKKDLPPYRFR